MTGPRSVWLRWWPAPYAVAMAVGAWAVATEPGSHWQIAILYGLASAAALVAWQPTPLCWSRFRPWRQMLVAPTLAAAFAARISDLVGSGRSSQSLILTASSATMIVWSSVVLTAVAVVAAEFYRDRGD